MSDHWSGPRATAQPVMDISDFYAFPSPERPGNFVLVMLVFPFAPPSALFSEAVDYRFRLRPVRVVSTGGRAAFAVGDEERALSVTFGAPQPVEGSDRPTQTGTCTGPSGEAVSVRVGDEMLVSYYASNEYPDGVGEKGGADIYLARVPLKRRK